MNFFSIFFALCSGVSIFPKLIARPLRFAFLHLFLLLLLCTVGVTAARCLRKAALIEETANRFFSRTGEIGVTEDRIFLTKSPENTRSYVAGDFRFDYFADPADFTSESLQESQADFNLILFPSGLAFRMKDFSDPDTQRFRLLLCPPDLLFGVLKKGAVKSEDLDEITRDRDRILTFSEVYETIRERLLSREKQKETAQKDPDEKKKAYMIGAKDITFPVCVMLALSSSLLFLMEAVLALFLSIIFFSLAQMLRSSPEPGKIPFRMLLITTIYATFPPLLIASMAQALELTFPSFQMTFFITFFIYQIFAFRSVFQSFDHSSGSVPGGRPPE